MNVGDRVRFVGREREMGKYHIDYSQLLGQEGVVVNAYPRLNSNLVVFEGFVDSEGDVEFMCWDEELELVG